MITILSVLKTGGVFNRQWVHALAHGIQHHAPSDDSYAFYCATDDPVTIHDPSIPTIALVENWPGWWSKVELFGIATMYGGPVLYFDLDTVIMGDLTPLFRYVEHTHDGGMESPPDITMLADFYQPRKPASGILAWNSTNPRLTRLYDELESETMMRFPRRMDYWFQWVLPNTSIARFQDHVPGILSYKKHCRQSSPSSAMVVCGHGQPRFSDPRAGWIHKEWRSQAVAWQSLTGVS